MRHRRRRAFTMLEVCVTLSLLGVFALLVVPLWNATWRVHKQAGAAGAAAFQVDAAAARLRADCWAAGAAEVGADGSLRLGPRTHWSVEAGEAGGSTRLVRVAAGARRAFTLPPAGEPPAFEARPGSVVLRAAGRRLVCPAPRTEAPR